MRKKSSITAPCLDVAEDGALLVGYSGVDNEGYYGRMSGSTRTSFTGSESFA